MRKDDKLSGEGKQEETEPKEEQARGAGEEAPEAEASVPEEAQEVDELAEARKEAEAYKDRWVRLAAEFENYKKRMVREFSALVQSASEGVIRDLLPILDAVDRALNHTGDGQTDSEEFRQGVKMIMEGLPRALQGRNLSEIEALGQAFDPNYHEALMQIDSADYDAGVVAEVVEKGYRLGGKVIRPAKVVVSRGKPEPGDAPQEREVSEETQRTGKEEG